MELSVLLELAAVSSEKSVDFCPLHYMNLQNKGYDHVFTIFRQLALVLVPIASIAKQSVD